MTVTLTLTAAALLLLLARDAAKAAVLGLLSSVHPAAGEMAYHKAMQAVLRGRGR